MRVLILLPLLLCSAVLSAQTYPKYKTKRVKDTVFSQAKRIIDIDTVAVKPVIKEPLSKFDELIKKGKKAHKDGEFEKSVDFFTKALHISTKDNEWYALECRGSVYIALNDYDKAANDFTKIINLNNTPYPKQLGYSYLMRACIAGNTTSKEDDNYICDDFKKARELGMLNGEKNLDANCDY